MSARSHHNRSSKQYYFDTKTGRHFQFDSFGSDHDKPYNNQAAKNAAIRFCADNPQERQGAKIDCYTITRKSGKYLVEATNR